MKKKLMVLPGVISACLALTVPVFSKGIIIVNIDDETTAATVAADEDVAKAGTYIGPKSVGGMTKEQLSDTIDELVDELKSKNITLVSDAGDKEIALAEMNIYCSNKDELIVSALGKHGYGNLIQQYKQEKEEEKDSKQLLPKYSVEATSIVDYLVTIMSDLVEEPTSGKITKDENGNFTYEKGDPGFKVDYDATYEAVVNAIQNYNGEDIQNVAIVGEEVDGGYDEAAFEGFGDVLGEWTTSFLCTGGNKDRATNLEVASSRIDGTVLMPGEEFNYNEAIQPFTEEGGYKAAPTIVDGNYQDELGGGMCQVSSTLYNAVLYAELEVLERRPHSKSSTYVEPGLDAMVYVVDGLNFRFANNTGHVIYIESFITQNYEGKSNQEGVTFKIWGTEYRDPERTISYESVTDSKEWPDGDLGAYTVKIDNSLDAAGNNYGGQNVMKIDAWPHASITAHVVKHVYMSGEEVSKESMNWVTYKPALGTMYFNEDTWVKSIVFDDEMNITEIKVYNIADKPTSGTKKTTEDETSEDDTSEDESTEKETKKPPKETTEKETKKPPKDTTEEPTEKETKKPAKETTEEPTVEETTEKPTKKPKDTQEETTEKATKKPKDQTTEAAVEPEVPSDTDAEAEPTQPEASAEAE